MEGKGVKVERRDLARNHFVKGENFLSGFSINVAISYSRHDE